MKPWASCSNREVANKWYKVAGARYEICRLNVEIRRLEAWVDAEDNSLFEAASAALPAQPLLAAEIKELSRKQHRINNTHRSRLREIYRLEGYTGSIPVERSVPARGSDVPQRNLGGPEDLEDREVNPYNDDSFDQEASTLEDTMLRLHVQ